MQNEGAWFKPDEQWTLQAKQREESTSLGRARKIYTDTSAPEASLSGPCSASGTTGSFSGTIQERAKDCWDSLPLSSSQLRNSPSIGQGRNVRMRLCLGTWWPSQPLRSGQHPGKELLGPAQLQGGSCRPTSEDFSSGQHLPMPAQSQLKPQLWSCPSYTGLSRLWAQICLCSSTAGRVAAYGVVPQTRTA